MTELRSKQAKWFEVVAKLARLQEDGMEKNVKETYVVDAMSFAEAEGRAIKELSIYHDLSVVNINPAKYGEVFFSDNDADDKFFKVTINLIMIDEKTEKEKKQKVCYLIQASTTSKVQKYIEDIMGKTMIDYKTVAIVETLVEDVFEHE